MAPPGRRLGLHLPVAGGVRQAVRRAHEIGATALQLFVDNPTAWRRRTSLPDDLADARREMADLDVGPVVIHASYLVNLAAPDEEVWRRSVDRLAYELTVAPAFGARFVNVHVGAHGGTGREAGIQRVAEGIAAVLTMSADELGAGAVLVLENAAGAGSAVGSTLEELEAILSRARALGAPEERLAFCLDTAHLWGAGIDVGTAAGVDALLADFDRRIGLGRLVLVHLNDSRVSLGSRLDRHEHLGAGQIGQAGLARFLTHDALAQTVYILETPGMDSGWDAVNLARARDLAAGRPLAPLPPEAFAVRSGRG